jgi:serine/threonine-protein kinase
VDSTTGYPFVVQEHLLSETLRSIIDAEKPFHPDDVAILVNSIADALSYARLRGVLHLALNPESVLVDFDGTVLITDFAIGKVIADLEPVVDAQKPYRAPELTSGEQGDARSDIYSAGVIAWEMLVGDPPEPDESGLLLDAFSVNPEVPQDVSAIVTMATHPDPARRFRSIEAFAAALDEWRTRHDSSRLPQIPEEPAPHFRFLEPEVEVAIESPSAQPGPDELDLEDADGHANGRLMAVLAWSGLALGILALGWVILSFLGSSEEPGPEVTRVANGETVATATQSVASVPNLVGLTLEQARLATSASITVSESRQDSTAEPGTIIEQNPVAGDPLKDEGIAVVLATDQSVNVLDGVQPRGASFEDLSLTLTELGLNVVRQDEGSDSIPEGQVIDIVQTSAVAGDTVTVVVSMGNRVQIPLSLQSSPLDDVILDLEDLGLEVGEPIAVSRARIEGSGVNLDDFSIEDGDVVGIQEESAGFGRWVPINSVVTPVYFDAELP